MVALLLAPLLAAATARAEIPAPPVMTLYRFNGPLEIPYYDVDRFIRSGPSAPTGTLAQGSSIVPCLVIRDGRPVTDDQGTPYVGFELVVDAKRATPEASVRFDEVVAQRRGLSVANHHCPAGTAQVLDVRALVASERGPRFDPPSAPRSEQPILPAGDVFDTIVRAFHASPECAAANGRLIGRRDGLRRAWDAFASANRDRWPADAMARARQLDYVMRTAIYEGHLGRGCSAYGACERNVIALSIRNRGLERCQRGQGCRESGDFEGVASAVAQYNIWDEYLTQTSGLTSCFLRPDLAGEPRYAKLQAMYGQSVGDVERILFGNARDLQAVFPGSAPAEVTRLRHYYHPPAMGKCFAERERVEYISGATAQRGDDFALIANTRIRVDQRQGDGYFFRVAVIEEDPARDVIGLVDRYPGFVIDGRKIELRAASRCAPYGTPRGCRFAEIGRLRKTPGWLSSGTPLALTCRVRASGEDCQAAPAVVTTTVGGVCDTAMQPIAGVP
ncbi:MAG: hypothetical protein ACRERC_14245 [Candidatus Binatia bacterium]